MGGAEPATVVALAVGPTHVVFVTLQGSTRELVAMPKTGGPVASLATSNDSRAFLGLMIDGDQVYFSSFTSLLRVPLAGGATVFVGESPNSVQYWIFSLAIIGDQLYWGEGDGLYQIAKGARDDDGTELASLPGTGDIIGHDHHFVVALSSTLGVRPAAEAFVEVDPATGAVGPVEREHAI